MYKLRLLFSNVKNKFRYYNVEESIYGVFKSNSIYELNKSDYLFGVDKTGRNYICMRKLAPDGKYNYICLEDTDNIDYKTPNSVLLPISEPKNSDKTVVYNAQRTRLDKLSQKYYDNPFHGWLILLANPIYGGVEENIPDKEIIRIPFPLTDSIQQYIKAVEKYKLLNGID